MTTYLAITIGPIYATIKQARKTRELWAASYIFSLLMRELLAVLNEAKIGQLLSPIVVDQNQNGAGVYPDRCFWLLDDAHTAKEGDYWQKRINEAIRRTEVIAQDKQSGATFFDPFFRIFAAKVTPELGDTHSAILQLNKLLDSLELQALIPQGDKQLIPILEKNIWKLYDDSKVNAVFIDYDHNKHRLPGLVELATSELKNQALPTSKEEDEEPNSYAKMITEPTNKAIIAYQRNRDKEGQAKLEAEAQEKAVLDLKQAFGKAFKLRHKYVCFVKADGDSVGATIGQIGNNSTAIQDFSKLLAEFAQNAVNKIVEFEGIPVYAGGDDLLFIAPIQNQKGKHIFDLLAELDKVFPSMGLHNLGKAANPDFKPIPALSYGLSIAYYKYPMFEALDNMNDLLFNDAKHFPGKNAVSIRVLKHSGQAFGATLSKSGTAYTKFTQLLYSCQQQEVAFLTSVMHKLSSLEAFLEDALKEEQTQAFFKHHFNEAAHAHSEADQYIKAVHEFIQQLWLEEKSRNSAAPKIKTVRQQLFAALRFIQFLNQADHD